MKGLGLPDGETHPFGTGMWDGGKQMGEGKKDGDEEMALKRQTASEVAQLLNGAPKPSDVPLTARPIDHPKSTKRTIGSDGTSGQPLSGSPHTPFPMASTGMLPTNPDWPIAASLLKDVLWECNNPVYRGVRVKTLRTIEQFLEGLP